MCSEKEQWALNGKGDQNLAVLTPSKMVKRFDRRDPILLRSPALVKSRKVVSTGGFVC
jgi:hypothetical protein